MKVFLETYDLHVFTIILLIFIIGISRTKGDRFDYKNKLLTSIFLLSILLLVLEILSNAIDGVSGGFAKSTNYVSNGLMLVMTPVLISHIASYLDFSIFESRSRLAKRWYYTQPFIIMFILVVANMFYPVLYDISDENVFSKGPLHLVLFISILIIYVYLMIGVIKNREHIKTNVVFGALIFFLFPSIVEIIDLFVGNMMFTFVSISFSSIFIYLTVETVNNYTDVLTGLYTKAKATSHMKIELKKGNEFALILLDMDRFKIINDEMGHVVGDLVLVDFGKKLHTAFSKDSLVARYGGDEFIIVTKVIDKKIIDDRLLDVSEKIQNSKHDYSTLMSFSYGIAFSDEIKDVDELEIVKEADKKMFEFKRDKNRLQRRSTD